MKRTLQDPSLFLPALVGLHRQERRGGIEAVGKLTSGGTLAGRSGVAVSRILHRLLLSSAKTRRGVDDDGHSAVRSGRELDAQLIGTREVSETVRAENLLQSVDSAGAEHLLD